MLPEPSEEDTVRSTTTATNIVQSTIAAFLPTVRDLPGQFYCASIHDLPIVVTLAHRDHCDAKDCITLYNKLQDSGMSESRARHVLMNGKACYDHYKYRQRRGRLQYEETSVTSVAEYDNKLLLLACLYVALCNWETSNDASQHHAAMLVGDNGASGSYCYAQVYVAALGVVETLGGHTLLTCRFSIMENTRDDQPCVLVTRLVTLFTAYKYASFIRPTLLVRAMAMVVCDVTHPRPLLSGKKRCHNHHTLRLKRERKAARSGTHTDNDDVIPLCHIIVSFIRQIQSHVQVDESMAQFLKQVSSLTRYSAVVRTVSGEGNNTSLSVPIKPPSSITNTDKKQRTYHGREYRCNRMLNDDLPGKVYDAISPGHTTNRYTIKRYPLYYTYNEEADSTSDTSVGDNIDYCMPRIAYVLLREIAVMQYLAAGDPTGVGSACCRSQTLLFDHEYVYICMEPGAISLAHFMRCDDRFGVGGGCIRALVANLIGDMCQAIEYCHRNDVMHGDVKPANFIVTLGSSHVQLIDFGLSEPHFSSSSNWHDTDKQTLEYRAPELLLGDHAYTLAVDVWALGCAIHNILTPTFAPVFYSEWPHHLSMMSAANTEAIDMLQLHLVLSRLASAGIAEFTDDLDALTRCPGWPVYTRALLEEPPEIFDPLCMYGIDAAYHTVITQCMRVNPAKRVSAHRLCQMIDRVKEQHTIL